MAVDLGSRVERDVDKTPAWDHWTKKAASWFGLHPNQLAAGPLRLFEGDESTYGKSGKGGPFEKKPGTIYEGWQREGDIRFNKPTLLALTDSGAKEHLHNSGKTASHEWAGHGWDTYFGKDFGQMPNYRHEWKGPLAAYLANPAMYNDNLATNVSGYGGPHGDYELQMMKDSWDNRGPKNQIYIDSALDAKRKAEEADLRQLWGEEPLPPWMGPKWNPRGNDMHLVSNPNYPEDNSKPWKNQHTVQGPYYKRNSAMHDALEDAFMKNPDRANLGEAQAPLANVVALALSDFNYDLNATKGRYHTQDAVDQTTDKRLKYPLEKYDSGTSFPIQVGKIKYDPYLFSAPERMARLSEDIIEVATGAEDDYHERFLISPDVVEDYRKGWGYLLDRLNPVDEYGNLINETK